MSLGWGGSLETVLLAAWEILLLIAFLWQMSPQFLEKRGEPTESAGLQPLPAPENPRWDGETGIGNWNRASDWGLTEREVVKY